MDPKNFEHTASQSKAKRKSGGQDTLFVNSVAYSFRILEAFDKKTPRLTLKEMSNLLDMEYSRVQRIANTLNVLGYLDKDDRTKEYYLSSKILDMGFRFLRSSTLNDVSQPYMLDLLHACDETVNLSIIDGIDVVFVARYLSSQALSINFVLGTRLPVYCIASGRAILSKMPQEDVDRILNESTRVAYSPYTIIEIERLQEQVALARAEGFALTNQEWAIGDISVAAPITELSGRCVGAINVAVPTTRWSESEVRVRLAPMVVAAAQNISRALGSTRRD